MSTASSVALPPRLSRKKVTLVEMDIARSTSLIADIEDDDKAVMFFDGFYELCTREVEARGGEIIKYMGDSCLACFGEDDCVAAIDAVIAVRDAFPGYCASQAVPAREIYAGVHVGEAVTGAFGPQGFKDVMGMTPSILFKMAGQGITVSEQVYRRLPSDRRGPWRKRGGHVTYVMR